MLCQNCNTKEATTHVKRIVNGEMEEFHLCHLCSEKLGYGNFFSGMSVNLENFLGSFFTGTGASSPSLPESPVHCKKCGCTFHDIVNTGRVGCADCYTVFLSSLLPSLQRIHGKAHHVGKISQAAGPKVQKAKKLESLRSELNLAISEQNYEKAAEIRDTIKILESEGIEA